MQGAVEPLRQRRPLGEILRVHCRRHCHLLQLHGIDCVKATSSSKKRFPRWQARNSSSGSIAQVAQQSQSLETLSTLQTSSPRLTLWSRSSPFATCTILATAADTGSLKSGLGRNLDWQKIKSAALSCEKQFLLTGLNS